MSSNNVVKLNASTPVARDAIQILGASEVEGLSLGYLKDG